MTAGLVGLTGITKNMLLLWFPETGTKLKSKDDDDQMLIYAYDLRKKFSSVTKPVLKSCLYDD